MGHLRVTLYLGFKTSPRSKPFIFLRENEPVGGTHFHMDGFAQRLILTQRQKATRKWPPSLGFALYWLKSPYTVHPLIGRSINLVSAMLARDRSGRIKTLGNFCTELTALDSYSQDFGPKFSHNDPGTGLIWRIWHEFIPRIEDFGWRVSCLNDESSKTPNETNSIALSIKENEKNVSLSCSNQFTDFHVSVVCQRF